MAEVLVRFTAFHPSTGELVFVRGPASRTVDGVPLWNSANPRCDEGDLERAAKHRDAFAIVGLGDSIMYGVSQAKEETYLEVARRSLVGRANRAVEVLNLAVPGYNTVQEDVVYEEIADRIEPDLVLVHYWIDDIHQYRNVGGYVVDFGYRAEDPHQLTAPLPLSEAMNDFLLVHSRAYDLLLEAMIAGRHRPEADDWARVSAPLGRIQERVSHAGGRLVVLSSADFSTDTPRPNGDLARLRELGSTRGFEVIDLAEWLPAVTSKEVARDSCHFNAEGHRLIGQRLAEYLLDRDLKPRDVRAATPR